ncbi:MAG TPA: AMP-binding protein, partial [Longimicrobium sp.]|nr:AMP-binding protein [Longimicrobium sp.]
TAPTPAWRRRLEEQLRGAGLEAVAVVGRPTRHEAFEPLDELLPRELLPRLFEDSAPPPSSAGAAPVSGARPSLVVGPARERPPGAPAVLTELLRDSAQRFPARTVTFIDAAGRREVLTFRELWEEGLAFCGGLQAAGLRSGEFLVFQLRSPRAFVTAFWGCALGGIIPVPVACPPAYDAANPLAARLVSISERLQRPWLLADGADAAGAEALGLRVMRCASVDRARAGTPAPLEPGDTALLPFTSGSTGVPKAVVLSHDNLIAMGEGMVRGGWHHPEDHPVSWMSLDHPAALANPHLVSLRTGSPHVLVARDYVLADVLRWLDLVTELRATSSWAPNFAFGLINDRLEKGERRAWDLGPMRTLTTAGEFVVPGTMRRLVELLAPYGLRRDAVCPGWGMAETSSFYCFERGVREDSAGAFVHLGGPMVGGEMRIVNDGDEVVPEGTVGHLQVRGAAVLARYLNAPEVNASSFTPDGWFRTGDLALMREGSVALTGREKEMLIIGGANVFPYEIETVVDAVEGVLPSYTIACGTREAGAQTDSILLFFALAPGAPPLGQVLRGIRERVGRVLGFSVSILVPLERGQIPRTELGKKGRTELKRRFEAGEFLAERRRVDRILGGPATMPRCLAVPRWAPRPQPRGEGPARALLLAGEEGLTAALRAKAGPGRRVIRVTAGPHAEPLAEGDGYQVDVRTPGAAARVLEALEARGVPVEDVVLAPPALEGSPARAAAALMAWALPWVQALAVRAAARPVRLFAALPEVEGPSGPGVARLLLPGLLWSAAAEQPGLEVR